MKWLEFLFPYRSHLESEVEYLRTQLAQSQRERRELEALIADLAKPAPKVQYESKPDGKLIPVQPRGWDAYRDKRRSETSQVQSADKENKDARSDG